MLYFKDYYKEKYHISTLDLADFAETNRLHVLVASILLFLFGVGDLFVIFVLHYKDLANHLDLIIYFGAFAFVSAIAFFYSIRVKNVKREKAYIKKTKPVYLLFFLGLLAGVYNFYIMGQPFNGVFSYYITSFLMLLLFTFSPTFYSVVVTIILAWLIPGVYKNFGVTGTMDTILGTVLMTTLAFYKRYTDKKLVIMIKKQKKSLVAKTFGNFTLLYEDKVVSFRRTQSTELIAYLIYKNGSSVKTKELISVLWGDYANSSRYGSSLRNLIVDIKHTFAELDIQNFFIADYNNFRINPEAIQCDYYDFLHGEKSSEKDFNGEFMHQYSWAEEATGFIERKIFGGGVYRIKEFSSMIFYRISRQPYRLIL